MSRDKRPEALFLYPLADVQSLLTLSDDGPQHFPSSRPPVISDGGIDLSYVKALNLYLRLGYNRKPNSKLMIYKREDDFDLIAELAPKNFSIQVYLYTCSIS